MKIRALLLSLVLVATACGPDETPLSTGGNGQIGTIVERGPDSVADDSSPRIVVNRPDSSEVLSRCGGARPDITVAPTEGPPDFLLTVESGSIRRGGSFEFAWRLPDGAEVTTGDEWVVECWVGDRWESAWQAIRVYGENPDYNFIDDGYGSEDDGWSDRSGTIVVPPTTPAGWYRLAERVSLNNGVSGDLLFREAWFEVVS